MTRTLYLATSMNSLSSSTSCSRQAKDDVYAPVVDGVDQNVGGRACHALLLTFDAGGRGRRGCQVGRKRPVLCRNSLHRNCLVDGFSPDIPGGEGGETPAEWDSCSCSCSKFVRCRARAGGVTSDASSCIHRRLAVSLPGGVEEALAALL